MTREAKEDLVALDDFIGKYSLDSVANSAEFKRHLPRLHKRYLALLIVVAEFDEQGGTVAKTQTRSTHLPSQQQLLYLRECVSDVGQSVFCWIHGAYKACRVMLRSSIETLVKGIACGERPEALAEKNIYKMFDAAELSSFFSAMPGKELLHDLNQKYSELSSDVHTALPANTGHVSSLNYFPAFSLELARTTAELIIYVTTRQIASFCLAYNRAFHDMHHRNKETVMDSLPAVFKKRVQNID